jgi:hypothetical protein
VLERIVGLLLGVAAALEPPPAVRLEGQSHGDGLVLRLALEGGGAFDVSAVPEQAATRHGPARRLALARGLASLLGGTVEPVEGGLELRLPPALA